MIAPPKNPSAHVGQEPLPTKEPRDSAPYVSSAHGESVPALIKQLASDVSLLLSSEVELAKAELREAAIEAKAGVAGMAGGAALANAGLLTLVLGLVLLLATQIAAWLSALIVGAIVLVIGVIMLKAGQAKVKPGSFTPDRTINAMKADAEAAKRKVS